ncbi:hypothetical protein [Kitasatospora indigofera]|uniref:hypothetical protein n=1 Tax=Kitasatospora indigofera TaxID=67307 RepID=UPI0036B34427
MTAEYQPRPRFACAICQDWGTVVPRQGGPTVPCPEACQTAQQLAQKNADTRTAR